MAETLKITPKPGASVCGFTSKQIAELAAALSGCLPAGAKMVYYHPTPPFDKTLPWQPLNAAGAPVGGVHYYNNGSWVEGQSVTGGPQGEIGPQGEPGETGPEGPQGEIGPQGPQGEPGVAGAIGPEGPVGPAGADGMDGAVGADGIQGPVGDTGPAGVTGAAGSNSFLAGSGPPSVVTGADGSVYFDNTFPYGVYGPKTAGVWPAGIPFGDFFAPSDLAGATALLANTYYFDTFSTGRVFSALPTSLGYAKIKIDVKATVSVNLDFHTNSTVYQSGAASLTPLTAAVTLAAGYWELVLTYVNGAWRLKIS